MRAFLALAMLIPTMAVAEDGAYNPDPRRVPSQQIIAEPEPYPTPEAGVVDDAYSRNQGVRIDEQLIAFDEDAQEDGVVEVEEEPVLETQTQEIEQPSVEAAKATLQVLDKLNATVTEIEIAVKESAEHNNLDIEVGRCLKTKKSSREENLVFMKVHENVTVRGEESVKTRFTGWMFSSNPALNSFEHPIYDIVLLGCSL